MSGRVIAAVVAIQSVVAYHGTESATASGGASWFGVFGILAVFGGSFWAFWTFVLEEDKF
jgi:hypothetical protein